MKRYLTILAAMLAGTLALTAQTVNGVKVESYTMERSGDFVIVDMNIDLSDLEVKGTEAVVLTPHIVRDSQSVALKSVGVYGRNRHFYYLRNEDKAPTNNQDLTFRRNKAPNMVEYHAVVPFEEWMDGCQLVFERADCGCNNSVVGKEGNILINRFPLEPYKPELIYIRPQAEKTKTRQISGRAYVDFPVNKMAINPSYRNNVVELAKITGTIDSVKADSDITITKLTIKGFASPESPFKNNERLAKGRTEALKKYVENLYHFGEGFITTSYEAEDWAGLERFVENSQLENRDAILEIIRSSEQPDRKEQLIMGKYPADYKYLLINCYPALRHSDYTIEYNVRQYNDVKDIERIMTTVPQKLSLAEFYILAETYESGSAELNELWEIAVRMYPNDEVANFNAANSAMDKGDYERAIKYLDKAGNSPMVSYSRGCVEVLREDYVAALPYLEDAEKQGVKEATPVIEGISSHWKVTQHKANR